MLIISDFHDYYDKVIGLGIDKSIVYNRKVGNEITTKSGNSEIFSSNRLKTYHNKDNKYTIEEGCVYFCGNIYPFLRVIEESFCQKTNYHFYDVKSFKEFVTNNNIDIEFKKRDIYFVHHTLDSNVTLEKYFNINNWKSLQEECSKLEIPVAVYWFYRRKLIPNAKLEDIQFGKIIDPYTAFMHISCFVSCEKPTETQDVSEKIKLQQKGFNNMSFKRCKQKRNTYI